MTHNGKRIADAEYFDDVLETGGLGGSGNAGILNSQGLDDYDSVREKIQADGVEVSVNCRMCNSKRGIVLEWVELYQIGSNHPSQPPLIPPGWKFSENNGTCLYMTTCPSCGKQGLAIHITPDEARKKIESAVNANLISNHQIMAWKQNIARIRGQQRR